MSTEPADETPERTPYWIAVAAVLFGLVAAIFFQVIIAVIGSSSGSSAAHQTPAMNNADNYLLDLSFVGSALYFTTVSSLRRRVDFGYRRIPWRTGLAALLAAGAAYYVVTLLYSLVFKLHGTDRLPSGLGVHHTGWAIVVALYVCAVAPMAEEFFFRGFLFGILRRMRVAVAGRPVGPWIAAAIVGILFGLAHFDSAQPEFLIPLGFLGFVLCIVRWRTRSLYPCMALHSLNNSIAFSANEHLGWGAGGAVALIVGSLVLIALVTGPLSAGRSSPVSPV
jgi:membrane protease YdiL (CAAX protease family)